MTSYHDLPLKEGGVLRVHDSSEGGAADVFTVTWHDGLPQAALLEPPLVAAAPALSPAAAIYPDQPRRTRRWITRHDLFHAAEISQVLGMHRVRSLAT